MRTLALDIGDRRTGVAFLDDATGIPLPLQTVQHRTPEELFIAVQKILRDRSIDALVIGLPLLPSGEEGTQAKKVRSLLPEFQKMGLPIALRDERYTTLSPRLHKNSVSVSEFDGDGAAACALLSQK